MMKLTKFSVNVTANLMKLFRIAFSYQGSKQESFKKQRNNKKR
jgi:hypothetical protein